MKKKQRRSFTREFKVEAVKLMENSDKSQEQIARELGITTTMLYNWRKKYSGSESSSIDNESQLTPEQLKIKQLELENARLREERDILKKAAEDSIGQRNSYPKILNCCGVSNEAYIYTRRERACFRFMETRSWI
ncbi:transposase [Pleionea sp. CnH1-48]|uniref:transposase n=1 Tax=Pleionea sp. CnH1-48 TaxID=2954494 RepID=UPI002097D6AA|nr:transposase [Pleionea sp. CnH1-48]MCO7225563.1 transposase [Pleionea sp. CnH1-48]